MHQLFHVVSQVAQWVVQTPMHTAIAHRLIFSARDFYVSLSPEKKAKLDRIVRRGGEMLLEHALPDVLGDIGGQAMAAIGNPQAAEFARAVVTRGASIGIEQALAEAKRG